MGLHTGSPELGQDKVAVLHNLLEAARFDTAKEFSGAEGPFAGSTPDIDSLGIKHENISVIAVEC
jgi:hypothetical protein